MPITSVLILMVVHRTFVLLEVIALMLPPLETGFLAVATPVINWPPAAIVWISTDALMPTAVPKEPAPTLLLLALATLVLVARERSLSITSALKLMAALPQIVVLAVRALMCLLQEPARLALALGKPTFCKTIDVLMLMVVSYKLAAVMARVLILLLQEPASLVFVILDTQGRRHALIPTVVLA